MANLFENLCQLYYRDQPSVVLNNIYYDLQNYYANCKNILAYNIIIVPRFESLYETKFKKWINLPENNSTNYSELKSFCKKRQIFLAVVDTMFNIITKDSNKRTFLNYLADTNRQYEVFVEHLRKVAANANIQFNMLVWLDDLNNEERVNRFCLNTIDILTEENNKIQ